MNIIKFDIGLQKKNNVSTPINEIILEAFTNDCANPESYTDNIRAKWNSFEGAHLRSLYSPDMILAAAETEHITYFMLDIGSSQMAKGTFEVLVIAQRNEDMDYSIGRVISDIERILEKNQIKFKLLTRNDVHLYPYSHHTLDIWGADYRIKANFRKNRPDFPEIIRAGVILLFSLTLFILYLASNFSDPVKNVFLGIFSSGFFFLITEFALKMPNFFRPSINIKDMSNVVQFDPRGISRENDEEITSPVVEEE